MVQNTVHIPAVDQNISIAMVTIPVVVIRPVTRVRGAAAQQHHMGHGPTVLAVIMAVAAVMVPVQTLVPVAVMVPVAIMVPVVTMVLAACPVLHAHALSRHKHVIPHVHRCRTHHQPSLVPVLVL